VSKQFYFLCKSIDDLWALCVKRLVKYQPDLWGEAINRFIQNNVSQDPDFANPNTSCLDRACIVMRRLMIPSRNDLSTSQSFSIHAHLYRHLLSRYIRYEMPVFYMPDDLILRGRSLGFYFFEPRYRRLIWEVMEPYPQEFRQGRIPNVENGITNPPMFIYANRAPLRRGTIACVVQVIHCNINSNGTANIEVVPVEHVLVEQVYEQVDMNDHLYFARVLRMRKEEQDFIELRDVQRMYPSLSLT
jgi:hypothetical protein